MRPSRYAWLGAAIAVALAALSLGQVRRDPTANDGGCAPPGPCVRPLADALSSLRAQGRITRADEIEIGGVPDLDGDGHPEVLIGVLPEHGVSGNGQHRLYVGGPSCRRFAGELFGATIRPIAASHCGARDLDVFVGEGCAGLEGTGAVLVYDGDAYHPDPEQGYDCECAIDEPDPRRDPRCPRID